MKLPISWLNEYVDVSDIRPEELAEKLTRAGLEVEGVETLGAKPLCDEIVVGEVVACVPHPNSDHMHIAQVTDGRETVQVVCGAPNCRVGLKTALAKIGGERIDVVRRSAATLREMLREDGVLRTTFASAYEKRCFRGSFQPAHAYAEIGLEPSHRSDTSMWVELTFWAAEFLHLCGTGGEPLIP
jgi:hypothetical protein